MLKYFWHQQGSYTEATELISRKKRIDSKNSTSSDDSDATEANEDVVEAAHEVISETVNCSDKTDLIDLETETPNITELDENDPELKKKVNYLCNKPQTDKKKTSLIWKFFVAEADLIKYTCIICDNAIKVHGGCTGNLKRHMRARHKKINRLVSVREKEPSN